MENSQLCITPISASWNMYEFGVRHSVTRTLVPGRCVSSPEFKAEGLKWVLQYYPNGLQPTPEASCSLFLKLVSNSEPVKASVQFEIAPARNHVSWYGRQRLCKIVTGSSGDRGNFIGIDRFMGKAFLDQMILPHDLLEIICSLKILEGGHVEAATPVPLQTVVTEVPELNLVSQLSYMLTSGELADVTFNVEGQKFPAHRSILAARSPVFKAELFGPMCEGNNNTIKINEMNPVVFNALLQYIYTDSIPKERGEEGKILDPTMPWATFTHLLLAAADRYAVESLRKICEKELCKDVSFETVVDVLSFANCHSFELLKESCLNLIAEPQNFMALACTQGYMQVMLSSPALLSKMQEKVSQRASITPDSGFKKPKRTN